MIIYYLPPFTRTKISNWFCKWYLFDPSNYWLTVTGKGDNPRYAILSPLQEILYVKFFAATQKTLQQRKGEGRENPPILLSRPRIWSLSKLRKTSCWLNQPIETYAQVKLDHSPGGMKINKYVKPPPRKGPFRYRFYFLLPKERAVLWALVATTTWPFLASEKRLRALKSPSLLEKVLTRWAPTWSIIPVSKYLDVPGS